MKKMIVGAVLLLAGVLQTVGIIISGVIYLPHLSGWSTSYASKLWFVIMTGKYSFNGEVSADGLGLGIFLVFGIIMILMGLSMLLIEYKRVEK